MVALQPRRLAREGVPIAAVLLFWNLLAGIAQLQNVGGPVGSAGVVMAALYVAVRGVSLSSDVLRPATGDVESVLYENASIAVPAGAWFLAAMAASAVGSWIVEFTWVVSAVETALAGGGLGVVALYAVAAGYRTLGDGGAAGNDGAGDGAASGDAASSDAADDDSSANLADD